MWYFFAFVFELKMKSYYFCCCYFISFFFFSEMKVVGFTFLKNHMYLKLKTKLHFVPKKFLILNFYCFCNYGGEFFLFLVRLGISVRCWFGCDNFTFLFFVFGFLFCYYYYFNKIKQILISINNVLT